MKVITKHNFLSISCIIFTCLVLGKIILEAFMQNKFGNDQKNILVMLFLSLVGTFVLSQHYRLNRFPLLIMFLIQYLIVIGITLLIVWISSFFEPVAMNGYKDMFISVSVPYIILAFLYYISLFLENRKANRMLQTLKKNNSNLN